MDDQYYRYIKEREDEAISKRRKDLVSLYRRAITIFSKLKIRSLEPQLSITFQPDVRVDITVFLGKDKENTTLSLYDFWTTEKCEEKFNLFVDAFKTGNLEMCQDVCRIRLF